MGLVYCPDCGRRVSDQAKQSCPECLRPYEAGGWLRKEDIEAQMAATKVTQDVFDNVVLESESRRSKKSEAAPSRQALIEHLEEFLEIIKQA